LILFSKLSYFRNALIQFIFAIRLCFDFILYKIMIHLLNLLQLTDRTVFRFRIYFLPIIRSLTFVVPLFNNFHFININNIFIIWAILSFFLNFITFKIFIVLLINIIDWVSSFLIQFRSQWIVIFIIASFFIHNYFIVKRWIIYIFYKIVPTISK
jgi:hypothetical protein